MKFLRFRFFGGHKFSSPGSGSSPDLDPKHLEFRTLVRKQPKRGEKESGSGRVDTSDIGAQQLLVYLGCPRITGDSSGACSFLSGDQLFGRLMFLPVKISGKESFSVIFLADFLLITQSRFFP